jgi:cyclic lactone autoinducer peptide
VKIKQIIAGGVLKIAEKAAKVSCNSASILGFHQPKEPENLALKLDEMKAVK